MAGSLTTMCTGLVIGPECPYRNVRDACHSEGVELLGQAEQVRYRHLVPSRSAAFADWPDFVPEAVREAVGRGGGIERLWRHQAAAAESLFGGRHTALATGTASGK